MHVLMNTTTFCLIQLLNLFQNFNIIFNFWPVFIFLSWNILANFILHIFHLVEILILKVCLYYCLQNCIETHYIDILMLESVWSQ